MKCELAIFKKFLRCAVLFDLIFEDKMNHRVLYLYYLSDTYILLFYVPT